MNSRDVVLDLLTVTTGDREDAENMLALIEKQAYADGFAMGYQAARNQPSPTAGASTHKVYGSP